METKKQIINLIKEKFTSNELSSEDLVSISNFCDNLALSYNTEDKANFIEFSTTIALESNPDPVPKSDADDIISKFDKRFPHLKREIVIYPAMMDFIINQKINARIYLIQRNNKLDIAYEDGSGKKYHLDRSSFVHEMVDFNDRKKDFNDIVNGHKKTLNSAVDANGYGCPDLINIPLSDLEDFKNYKNGKSKPDARLITGINEDGRVALVMRFAENNVIDEDYNYDTFLLCPPHC